MKALTLIGAVSEGDAQFYFHGRSRSTVEMTSIGVIAPGRRLRRRAESLGKFALLTPVVSVPVRSVWTDYYDDWSIAPNINPLARAYAAQTYRRVGAGHRYSGLTTCNSEYMRRKLRLSTASIIPNGVDSRLAQLTQAGDAKRRAVILGRFFSGRTDLAMMEQIVSAGRFDEVVIGAPSDSKAFRAVMGRIAQNTSVRVFRWLTHEDLASIAGSRTVAVIPHVVTDYTLSQDLMKIYQFLALGIRPIVPRLLWPEALEPDFAYLYDFGSRLEQTLAEWVTSDAPSEPWRLAFTEQNSWTVRARRIVELLRLRSVADV